MKVIVAMLGAAILLTAKSAGADRGVVTIRLSPAFSFEPASVRVQVNVLPDADNRVLRVSADSDSFFWSSERQLDGADAPRISEFHCRDLPAGDYSVRAQVIASNGRLRSSAQTDFRVLGR